MKTTRHEETAMQNAICIISNIVDTDAIYLFGITKQSFSRTNALFPDFVVRDKAVHLYLLVFVNGEHPNATERISALVRQKSLGTVTVTLLFYQTSKLNRIKGNHRSFLSAVLASGTLIFQREGYVIPEFGTVNPDEAAKNEYWKHCRYMALCCFEAENAMENPNAEPVQAVLLHGAVEQVALGVIYVFLGCRPGYHGLGYLLELCSLCLAETDDIFPRQTIEEQKRFAVLSMKMEDLRYRQRPPSITDIEILRARAHRFLGVASTAVERRGIASEKV